MRQCTQAASTVFVTFVVVAAVLNAQKTTVTSSYGPTNQTETFDQIKTNRLAVKAARASAHADLLSPYLHDGRCFTLEDTVEYFNLVLQLRLNAEEKKDIVAFLQTL